MNLRKVLSVALAGGCAVAIGFTAPAEAGAPVTSQVTMRQSNHNPAKFKGRVTSSSSDCVVGRKVLIYRVRPGDDEKVGKTFATESGKYTVTIPMQSGHKLYAQVEQDFSGTLCLAARSETVNA